MADKARIRRDRDGLYIYLRWSGKRHHISCYQGHPELSFKDNEGLALKAKNSIDREIERGIFRAERWKTRSKKLYNLRGYFDHWIKQVTPDLSTATLADYRNSFENHILPVLGEDYVEDITYDRIVDLRNKIERAPHGKKNVLGALRRLLKFAYLSGHIPAVPPFPEFTGKNKVIKPRIKWVQPKERMEILEAINRRHRPIFTFIALTGCRPSEARAFRKVDIEGEHVVFAVTFGREGELKEVKGQKIQPWPLTEALKTLFDETPKNLSPHVFVNPYTGKSYKRDTLNKVFRKARAKVGINVSLNEWGRKSSAMEWLQVMDKSMVSYLLRHSDPRMIDHYAEYLTAPMKRILDKVHKLHSTCTGSSTDNGKKSAG